MLPSRVIYKNKEYETIGFIKLNNGSFLILQNDDEIIDLDLSKTSLKLDLKFEIKDATKVEVVFIDYIVEAIKNNIKNNVYQNKEELKSSLADLNRFINTNPELLGNMKQLDFKDDVVDKTMTGLLSYFDEVMKSTSLKSSSLTNFKIDGKDYVRDESGNLKLMENNENIVEQVIEVPSINQNVINQTQDTISTMQTETLDTSLKVEEPQVEKPQTEQIVDLDTTNPTQVLPNEQTVENATLNEYVNPIDTVVDSTPEYNEIEKPKVKSFSLYDNKGKAAFVDTLLLSFIVGLVSGMYLVFLIILIMS